MEKSESANQPGLLPNFCAVGNVFMLAILVELLAVVLALAPGDRNTFWEQLAMTSMFAQWLALLNAALLCIWRQRLNALPVVRGLVLTFILLMFTTLILSYAVIIIGRMVGFYAFAAPDWLQFFYLRNLATGAVVYAVVLRYFYIQHQWQLQIRAQSHAQIQALKARIRPHFLFNSMNTIASLISIDAGKAERAVEDLAELFRASLREKTEHSLEEEFALTRSYLDIEKLRLGERLQVDWQQAADLPLDMEIPGLCLQPLVENAIYHGVEPMAEGGLIGIAAQIEIYRLCLVVTNPTNASGRMKAHKSNHMAQDNIRQRLALMYGADAAFESRQDAGHYSVTIKIPLVTHQP
ncbi:MAG: His kinase protein [Pseudomonadota bacterium]|nr:His kinase protein [Pseudomonadota bacterium]